MRVWRIAAVFIVGSFGIAHASPHNPHPLVFLTPTAQQIEILRNALGHNFVDGSAGDGPPELQISAAGIFLNHNKDFVVRQRSLCDNHSCPYKILIDRNGIYFYLDSIQSSGNQLYVLTTLTHGFHDIVAFDHVTNDCLACSPPKPVLYHWNPEAKSDGVTIGHYVEGRVLVGVYGNQFIPFSQ